MNITVTHIFHNCFVLDVGDISFVFDIPAKRFRVRRVLAAIEKAVAGRDVVAFFSHSHLDHFAPDYLDVCAGAKSLRAVISDDIEEMYPEMIFKDALIAQPDETYVFEGIKIETLMSNDLGVAFLIETAEGVRIYNGGDLACWDWDSSIEAQRKWTRNFFENGVDKVANFKPHIVFSNVERRLSDLAGAPFLIEKAKPQYFIPTHALGRTQWLEGIHERLGIADTKCFNYRWPGDLDHFELVGI